MLSTQITQWKIRGTDLNSHKLSWWISVVVLVPISETPVHDVLTHSEDIKPEY